MTTMPKNWPARLVDPALFVGDPLSGHEAGAPVLRGSRCSACGAVTFPAQGSCARCTGTDVEPYALATTGTIWSHTVQGFPPKPPYLGASSPRFAPYGVGYVDLGGEVLVESRIVTDDLASLRIGMGVGLVFEPFHHDDDGTAVLTFAFRPTDESPDESTDLPEWPDESTKKRGVR